MWKKEMRSVLLIIFFCLTLFISNIGFRSARAAVQETEPQSTAVLSKIKVIEARVKKGDTASSLLGSYLPLKTIYEICKKDPDIFCLAEIKTGQPYKIILKDKKLARFEYEIDTQERVVVQTEKDQVMVYQESIEYEKRIETISGVITDSLFRAVRKTGEKVELAIGLSDIFAWDIDFIRDVRPGDQFTVLVEKRYRDGKLHGYGQIKAAFFNNQQTLYKAFLYKDAKGVSKYYDENGKALQKAFLKAPLPFSRISSKFTKKRMHPIFNEYRPHQGVDYAAPTGTPIKTVGDGVIAQMGRHKGMGNYITIRHYNGYVTSYNHMSRFAKEMKPNKRVAQGDVIGYVGMTGYATGPHLDFRMKKDGRFIDPLKHKSPSATPVNPDEMIRFLAQTNMLTEQLLSDQKQTLMVKTDI